MMIKFNNIEGQNLSDPQDLRRKIKPFSSVRKRRNIQNPAFTTPLPPQTIFERLVLDLYKVRTLLHCFRQKISMQAIFVQGDGIIPTPIVTRKGIEVEWTTIVEDTVIYETVTELYPRPSLTLRRKIGKNKEICYLKRFIGTNLDIQKKQFFEPYEYPLPKQTKFEVLELNASEETRDMNDLVNFIIALDYFNKHKEKKKANTGYCERVKKRNKKNKKKEIKEKKLWINGHNVTKDEAIKEIRCWLREIEIDFKFNKNVDVLKKNKKKNQKKVYCRFDPDKLQRLGLFLESLEKENKFLLKKTIKIPTFITQLGIFEKKSMFCKIGELLDLLIFYNLCYIVFWSSRAYKIYLSRGYFKRLYEKFINKKKNIKKMLTLPFEDFLNGETELFFKYENVNKKIKKLKKKNPTSEKNILEVKKKIKEKKRILKAIQKKSLKENLGICSGMHHIDSLEVYTSFLFSLYMGKKQISLGRSDDDKCVETHKRLMSREPDIDQDFKKFVEEETSRLFRDFSYRPNLSHCPPMTSYCYRGEDVNLHNFLVTNDGNRQDFVNFWEKDELSGLSSELFEDFVNSPATHQVKVIHEKGKTRVITTNHPATFLMKDFQWNVHRHLRNNPTFFYIGKQVRNRIDILPRAKDEWVLSGDYENSTDFIPCAMTRGIYDVILGKLKGRPLMKRLVRHSLEDEVLIYPDEEEIVMKSGQLMGGLLSFPALCIMNHCISKYLGINKKKVNGDDLLALTRESCRKEWVEKSALLGMSPNDSKSHFHPKFGTFNSQLIALKGRELYHVPHFSITKLSNSSLGDICNISGKVHTSTAMQRSFAEVWMENHSSDDLFTGNELSKVERDFIRPYDSFFFYWYNVIRQQFGGFLGAVGEFSRFYDPDDLQKMINHNWSTEFSGETFAVGNGVIRSLRDLWKVGDRTNFFFILKNLKPAGTGLHSDENPSIP